MAHVRQQIRDYVADLLVNFIYDRFGIVIQDRFNVNLEARQGGEIGTLYKFRRYALDEEKLPALIVYTTTDLSRLATIGQRTMTHDLELRVDIINKGSSLNIFENIEQFSAELISKVEDDFFLGGLAKSCVLASSDFDVETGGEKAIGSGKMIFNVQYTTAINNCQVSI
jgi:hypothetical protein